MLRQSPTAARLLAKNALAGLHASPGRYVRASLRVPPMRRSVLRLLCALLVRAAPGAGGGDAVPRAGHAGDAGGGEAGQGGWRGCMGCSCVLAPAPASRHAWCGATGMPPAGLLPRRASHWMGTTSTCCVWGPTTRASGASGSSAGSTRARAWRVRCAGEKGGGGHTGLACPVAQLCPLCTPAGPPWLAGPPASFAGRRLRSRGPCSARSACRTSLAPCSPAPLKLEPASPPPHTHTHALQSTLSRACCGAWSTRMTPPAARCCGSVCSTLCPACEAAGLGVLCLLFGGRAGWRACCAAPCALRGVLCPEAPRGAPPHTAPRDSPVPDMLCRLAHTIVWRVSAASPSWQRLLLAFGRNPDGVFRGHLRTNAAGANLNREVWKGGGVGWDGAGARDVPCWPPNLLLAHGLLHADALAPRPRAAPRCRRCRPA